MILCTQFERGGGGGADNFINTIQILLTVDFMNTVRKGG